MKIMIEQAIESAEGRDMENFAGGRVGARVAGFAITLAASVAILAGASAHAEASPSVELRFKGSYVAATCTVVGSANISVTLPTVNTRSLATSGNTAGATVFTIPVQCDGGLSRVRAYFQSGATTDANTGNLIVQSVAGETSASNVQVALKNMDGTAIKVGDRSTMKTVPITSANTTIPMNFIASYYSTGAATAGAVQTFVTYVLEAD
ncbi:fimbrial protein [Trinickia mobilis]|uniref:fimbrial protein n=1 Tax=Trinickia mobilis TaxID=2816356 RepID=UPI001F5CA927|nr:fimbrial protein [Trinickia mobilis]